MERGKEGTHPTQLNRAGRKDTEEETPARIEEENFEREVPKGENVVEGEEAEDKHTK
jgi:hypothetical protein